MTKSTVENKRSVAIGKIICETLGVPWNIPHSHFIVNQTPSGLFEATNIEFVLDSVGASIDEAARILMLLTADYVKEVMIKGLADIVKIAGKRSVRGVRFIYRKYVSGDCPAEVIFFFRGKNFLRIAKDFIHD